MKALLRGVRAQSVSDGHAVDTERTTLSSKMAAPKRKRRWSLLRSIVNTSQIRNWRKPAAGKSHASEGVDASSMAKNTRQTREDSKKAVFDERKKSRFNKLATRRSSFLSTNINARLAKKQKEEAEKRDMAEWQMRKLRRRSIMVGDTLEIANLAKTQTPLSPTYSRRNDFNGNLDDEDAVFEFENKLLNVKTVTSTEQNRLKEPENVINEDSVTRARMKKDLEEKISEVERIMAPTVRGEPGMGYYSESKSLSGRDQLSLVRDDRNRGKLPNIYTRGSSRTLWIAGGLAHNDPIRGFRLAQPPNKEEVFSRGSELIDADCMGENRLVIVMADQKRLSRVYFMQGEAAMMKGKALTRCSASLVLGLPNDIEHAVCSRGTSFVLSRSGEVFSIAPKPSEEPRYVWEAQKKPENADTEKASNPFVLNRIKSLCGRRVVTLSAGPNHVLAINAAGVLWSWGEGFGLGHGRDVVHVARPKRITELFRFRGLRVLSASAGSHHSLIIAVRSRPQNHLCSHFKPLNEINSPKNIHTVRPPNEDASLTLGGDAENVELGAVLCLSWGVWDPRLGSRRLATTVTCQVAWRPQVMNLKDKRLTFRKLAAGGQHSLAIEGSPFAGFRGISKHSYETGGALWSFGNNQYGQLGLGHNRPQWTPTKLRYPANVIDCAAGERHSIAVTESGECWSFGSNASGETGHCDEMFSRVVPRRVMGGVAGLSVRAARAGGAVSMLFCDTLQRDNQGKWIVTDASRKTYRHESLGISKRKPDRKSSQNNRNSHKKRGWSRVKTFEKARIRKQIEEEKLVAEKMKEEKEREKRKRRRDRKQNRESTLDRLSSSSSEDEEADAEAILKLRRKRIVEQQRFPNTFMKAPRFFVPEETPKLPKRTPPWLRIATGWMRNSERSNVGGSEVTGAASDRELWQNGRILYNMYRHNFDPDFYDGSNGGRQTRMMPRHLQGVRDSMFKYKKYRKRLIKAQAMARRWLVRIRVDLHTLSTVVKARRTAERKLTSSRRKVEILKFDLAREKRILEERIEDIQGRLGGRAYMLMKYVDRMKLKKKLAKYVDRLEERDPDSKVTKLRIRLEATCLKEATRNKSFEETLRAEREERERQRLADTS